MIYNIILVSDIQLYLLLLLSHFSRVRLCNPIDGSPPGSPIPGILQARTLEWVAIFFSNAWKWKVKVKLLSPVWLFTTRWTAAYFIWGGSKITADGDCSHEIKRHLFFGRKVMTNLDSILKSRDITLPTKVHLVKAMVFPVVMYGCESWTVKEAECWRIDAFELWCWRRLFMVPWTARRSNQSILKEINPEYSLESTNAEAETPVLWPPDVKS